jgi:hypothetical protein
MTPEELTKEHEVWHPLRWKKGMLFIVSIMQASAPPALAVASACDALARARASACERAIAAAATL